MHSMLLFTLAVLILGLVSAETDIITLNSDNFESLTQASTGATTGNWLIKFYAPWCGHCKNMQPAYEEVATALKGEINVAEVDVAAHRALGSRFDIKGFPTLIYLNGGKLYKYGGSRAKDAMISFARETFKNQDVYTPSEVPPPLGYFGELSKVFTESYKLARDDLSAGNYLTVNVLTCVLPLIFIGLSVMLAFLPSDDEIIAPKRTAAPAAAAAAAPAAASNREKAE